MANLLDIEVATKFVGFLVGQPRCSKPIRAGAAISQLLSFALEARCVDFSCNATGVGNILNNQLYVYFKYRGMSI